jgi:hypothetical protein
MLKLAVLSVRTSSTIRAKEKRGGVVSKRQNYLHRAFLFF